MKKQQLSYKSVIVKGVKIFYREAGDKNAPHLILLNGVPNSSSAFDQLMQNLQEDLYMIAPDFPGFGNSGTPKPNEFEYSFENLSKVIELLINQLGMSDVSVYALGYGGPIAFRIAQRQPAIFKKYILQNTNAYEEGLGPAMVAAAPFLTDRNLETEKLVAPLLEREGMEMFFLNGISDEKAVNPDHINTAIYHLSRPGQKEIQLDLLYDYRNNIAEYPKWQNFLKRYQPEMLLVWGKNDVFFPLDAAEAFKKDVPNAELWVYDTSHLALEEYHQDIAEKIKAFMIG
ncbi:alpha/beta fold hydrolase [Pedobacter miscanthi]|uniref:Alpha/beta hydrolase n=1 Tax=Pedobacter miscanthi TaxID=2259170 RepID=A0A366L3I0_9SPHI|nr:alpha/beta hydrolase [Pedobacter miscanthi]RBQ07864.1 alpha/beta hydrolase [Pedobacter miscanthi]